MFPKLTVALVILGIALCSFVPAQVTRIPVTPDNDQPSTEKDTRILMQAKLANAQNGLEGLVSQDFKASEKAAGGLARISLARPPKLDKDGDGSSAEIYEHFWLEFARLAGQLERHARNRELAATAYVQQNMTANCIACHDFIRDNP
jgi:hypothetical protein